MERNASLEVLVIVASLLVASTVWAETWVESQLGATLELRADGTYSFVIKTQGMNSSGRYAIQGEMLTLQDQSGVVAVFQCSQPAVGRLLMRDARGATLLLTLAGGAQASRVLAEADGFRLSAADLQPGIDLIELVIGQPIDEQERGRLEAKSIQEFPQGPAAFLQQLQLIRTSMDTVRASQDAVRVALLRQALYADLYLAVMDVPKESWPELVRVIDDHIRPLAVDRQNRLVFTNRDAEALVDYLDLVARSSGQTPYTQIVDRSTFVAQVADQIVRAFPSFSLGQKQGLCTMHVVWRVIEANLARMTEAQRQQYGQNLVASMPQAQPLTQVEGAADPAAAMAQRSLEMDQRFRDHQNKMWYRNNMFNMMQNMLTDQHVTSMNIIENMGGTDNYWKAVERDY